MNRCLLILCLFLGISKVSFAQKDTLVYYLKNSGKVTLSKDSADLFLVILPPDTSLNKNLSVIKCYYPNGKISFIAGSKTHGLPLELEGPYMSFFGNGRRKSTKTYHAGQLTGDATEYYPNGRLYNTKSYSADKIFLREYHDSTGSVLSKNGKGAWKEYNEDFTKVVAEGQVEMGVQQGRWIENSPTDTVYYDRTYDNGTAPFLSIVDRYTSGGEALSNFDVSPEFPGGKAALNKFVAENLKYPEIARKYASHGRVMVAFIVEKDGYLDNIRVVIGIGNGCDEEAIRVIEKSPKWIPATKDGQPVRTQYATGVDFKIPSQ
jgi:TonB family protein